MFFLINLFKRELFDVPIFVPLRILALSIDVCIGLSILFFIIGVY